MKVHPTTIGLFFLLVSLSSVSPQSVCEDGVCSNDESPVTCPQDCGLCGNNICDINQFENRDFCPEDCPSFIEYFAFLGDGISWVLPPPAAEGDVIFGDEDEYLQVNFPARVGPELQGYFTLDSSTGYALLLTEEFLRGYLYYSLRINHQPVREERFPDVLVSVDNNGVTGYLYYYHSDSEISLLSLNDWTSFTAVLDPSLWLYTETDFAMGEPVTLEQWNAFSTNVEMIYINGQYSSTSVTTDIDDIQLSPEGDAGVCDQVSYCSDRECGIGCGDFSCGTCQAGTECDGAFCIPLTGTTAGTTGLPTTSTGTTGVPPTTGTTGVPPTTGTTGVPPTTGTTGVPPTTGTTGVPPTTGTTGVPSPFCGDGTCDAGLETKTSCPEDCQICGDFVCDPTETISNCPTDCQAVCGNGVCEETETPTNCGDDCEGCGDGFCDSRLGESVFNCQEDCGTCGDNVCDFDIEDSRLCPEDCGYCGNGVCDTDRGENQVSCEIDCQSVCGDGLCTAGETQQTCPSDCSPPSSTGDVIINMNFAGLIPALDCCTCCGKK